MTVFFQFQRDAAVCPSRSAPQHRYNLRIFKTLKPNRGSLLPPGKRKKLGFMSSRAYIEEEED
jgi:hypothetical protein